MLIGSEKAKDAILRDLSRLQVEKDKRGHPSNHVPIQNLQPDSFVIPCWVFPLVFPWHAPSPFISFLVLFFLCYVSAPLKGCTVVKLKFPRSGLVIHRSKKGANIIYPSNSDAQDFLYRHPLYSSLFTYWPFIANHGGHVTFIFLL